MANGDPQQIELLFPSSGVIASSGYGTSPDGSTHWAVNITPEGPHDRRRRGGVRPGLEKRSGISLGEGVTAAVAFGVASSTGAESVIAFLTDSELQVMDTMSTTPVVTQQTGNLLTEGGDEILLEDDSAVISVGDTTFPAGGGGRLFGLFPDVYSVDGATGIRRINVLDGVIETVEDGPEEVTLGCIYRDRLVLGGADNAIYMSRQGDHDEWNYGAVVEDTGRALAFQLSLAGGAGDVATALEPFRDATLICASKSTLWVVRGDPASGGGLQNVSMTTGIITKTAYVWAEETLYFLALDGLYRMGPDGSGLENVSKTRLPLSLRDIDLDSYTVKLGYDHDRRTISVFVGSTQQDWMFDIPTESFWPIRYQTGHEPFEVVQFQNEMLMVGSDGYLRQAGGTDDDGTDITSHLLLGPVSAASPTHTGRLDQISGSLGEDSSTITWRIVTGESAEEAVENAKAAIVLFDAGSVAEAAVYVQYSGTFSAGWNRLTRPRVRAPWAVIWLQSTNQWAFEGVSVLISPAGRKR